MASTKIYLDTRFKGSLGNEYPVKLRITHQRKAKYYPTGIKLTEADFDKVTHGKKKNEKERQLHSKLHLFEEKARDCISKIQYFTFEQFEKLYISNRGATDSLELAFKGYASELMTEGRVGYATNYLTAFNSLNNFKKGLKFHDINPSFLRSYEMSMKAQGKSVSTIGIYLRPLRTIVNRAIDAGMIDKTMYPFGRGKYEIPTGNNIKKALSKENILKILNYLPKNENEQFAKDMWVFSYLSNGMNMADIFMLKRGDLQDQRIYFVRQKTKRSKRKEKKITVVLQERTKDIIRRYSALPSQSRNFLFPFLNESMTAVETRNKVQLLTKKVNTYLDKIRRDLGFKEKITTYSARHSYATELKRNSVSIEFIRESLGHSSLATTNSYLDSFEESEIERISNFLL